MGPARDVRRLDEEDVRIRPGRRGTRPRSKQRPAHEDAASGMVVAVDRGRYTVLIDDRTTTAVRARELGRKGIVVGDRVDLVGDLGGTHDSLARIVRIHERRTVLRRTADDTEPVWGTPREQRGSVIVANADQLVIVASLADPPPSYGLIDRCLVAALTAGIEPVLCLTKSDLAGPEETLRRYAALDVPAVVTRRGGPLGAVRSRLHGHLSVLVGHSGVGKSTLINALVPDADRATAAVSAIGKGRHTSSSAVALRLPAPHDGWVVDTPGVRSFGLAHVTADDLLWAFPDLEDGAVRCRHGCEHLDAAIGCTLDDWVADGHATPERLAAFRRLLESRATVAR